MDEKISKAASAVGCSGYLTWEICPDHFANILLTASKRYARFLKDCRIVTSHSAGLETVARAAGQPNWHAFNAIAQGLIDKFDPSNQWPRPAGGREPIKTLIPAFAFLVQASPDCAPTDAEQIGLRTAAERLAQVSGRPLAELLNLVGKMNGADSWENLLSRKPEESKLPLYGFEIDATGNGRFVISSACAALIEQQDVLFQDFFSRPEKQQREFEIQLEKVLSSRPDFLEGLLAKTAVLRFKPELRKLQGKIYRDAISKAEELIPAGFKGEISWGDVNNRFYHRLLYGAMIWHSHEGQTTKAVALARKQLRLNKGDNLGIRMWLPVLLCADDKISSAIKAAKKMTQDDGYSDATVEFVNAICYFANGELRESAQALYLSVFQYPPMRHVIAVDFDSLYESISDASHRRLISPDPDTMVEQYVSASMFLSGIDLAFQRWLDSPEIFHTEKILAREFHSNWRQPNGSLATWRDELENQAMFLSVSANLD